MGPGGDEAVAGDLFSADDAFEEEGVCIATENFESGDRGEAVGEKLAIDRDDLGAGRGDGGEFVEGGEIAAHGWMEGKCRGERSKFVVMSPKDKPYAASILVL